MTDSNNAHCECSKNEGRSERTGNGESIILCEGKGEGEGEGGDTDSMHVPVHAFDVHVKLNVS